MALSCTTQLHRRLHSRVHLRVHVVHLALENLVNRVKLPRQVEGELVSFYRLLWFWQLLRCHLFLFKCSTSPMGRKKVANDLVLGFRCDPSQFG